MWPRFKFMFSELISKCPMYPDLLEWVVPPESALLHQFTVKLQAASGAVWMSAGWPVLILTRWYVWPSFPFYSLARATSKTVPFVFLHPACPSECWEKVKESWLIARVGFSLNSPFPQETDADRNYRTYWRFFFFYMQGRTFQGSVQGSDPGPWNTLLFINVFSEMM